MIITTQTTIDLEEKDSLCVTAHERFGGTQLVSLHRGEFSLRLTPAQLPALREAVAILEGARELQEVG